MLDEDEIMEEVDRIMRDEHEVKEGATSRQIGAAVAAIVAAVNTELTNLKHTLRDKIDRTE